MLDDSAAGGIDDRMRNIGQKSGAYFYLNDDERSGEIKSPIPEDYIHFGEDDQTFYVTKHPNPETVWDCNSGPCVSNGYEEGYDIFIPNPDLADTPPSYGYNLNYDGEGVPGDEDIYGHGNFGAGGEMGDYAEYINDHEGLPDWGIARISVQANEHEFNIYNAGLDWDAGYRHTNDVNWHGFHLAALLMEEDSNAKTLWNNDAFFDYMDRATQLNIYFAQMYASVDCDAPVLPDGIDVDLPGAQEAGSSSQLKRYCSGQWYSWYRPIWERYRQMEGMPVMWPGTSVAPSGLTAEAASDTQIDLSWVDNSDNEEGFRIERSEDNVNFTEITTVVADVISYSDTGLTAGTTYYYRARAYNASSDSGYSNVASVTTLLVTTYYLDEENGDDVLGDGSSDNPWQTLAKAQSESQSGDTVVLRTGNYGIFTESSAVGRTDWITYKADQGHTPIINNIFFLTAFSDVPKNFLILKCCLIHLKNISTRHRYRYNSAIVNAGSIN